MDFQQKGREVKWFLKCMKNYGTFSGRAPRLEFWVFLLVCVVICTALIFIDGVTGTLDREAGLGLLSGIFLLAILVPSLAVGARRLHDTGRTGWWQLINLIPLIGPAALLILLAWKGSPGENRYGAVPDGDV